MVLRIGQVFTDKMAINYGLSEINLILFKLPIWGICLFLGLTIGLFLFYKNLKKNNMLNQTYINAFIHGLFWGFIGSGIYNVLFFGVKINKFYDIVRYRQSFGVFLAFLIILIYLKIKKENSGKFLDILLLPTLIAATITRIGCAIILDEVGTITTMPWGLFYANAIRHPIAIYYVISNLIIIILLLLLQKKWKSFFKKNNGILFTLGMLLYSLKRFLLDYLREMPTILWNLDTNQVAYLSLLFISLVILSIQLISVHKKIKP